MLSVFTRLIALSSLNEDAMAAVEKRRKDRACANMVLMLRNERTKIMTSAKAVFKIINVDDC